MATPRALILRAPGTNCEAETHYALTRAGAEAEITHILRLRENPSRLNGYQILIIPGGFSYGDDVGAGAIFAGQLAHFLADALRAFRGRDTLILGICNGFQVLLRAGLLMPPDEDGPIASLALNTSGRYIDRWVGLRAAPGKCPFLKNVHSLELPIAHAEGRFVTRTDWELEGLKQAGQVVLTYVDNPNGSAGDVAGLCDVTGRVLGLMPHPERHLLAIHHPQWTRRGMAADDSGDGAAIFRNAVDYFAD